MNKLLILSPYDGYSHGFWRKGLAAYLAGEFEITEIALPPRFYSWRQRGNSLTYAYRPELQQAFDLIVATSMTDLSALRGLNPVLGHTPAIAYFHENQFAYPGENTLGLVERQLTSVYTALSANWLFFNSEFNRTTFLKGAIQLLKKMPDEVPPGILDIIERKSSVVPVALDIDPVTTYRVPETRVKIAWNHRWEHDKGPGRLCDIVTELLRRGADVELSLFGQQFSKRPPEFDTIENRLRDSGSLGELGFVKDRNTYLSKLSANDFVLSTADQEFQGLAIQEAMAVGCIPVVPDALSYPEYVPASNRYQTVSEAVDILLGRQALTGPMLDNYSWSSVGPMWHEKLDELYRKGSH